VQFVSLPCIEKCKFNFLILLSVIRSWVTFLPGFCLTPEYTKPFLKSCVRDNLDTCIHSDRLMMWMEFIKEYRIYKAFGTVNLTLFFKPVLSDKDLAGSSQIWVTVVSVCCFQVSLQSE